MLLSLIDDIPQKKRAKSFSMDRSNSEKKKKLRPISLRPITFSLSIARDDGAKSWATLLLG